MKNLLTKNLLAASLLLSANATMATPITINFNNTAGGAVVSHGVNGTYTESGFNLTATNGTELFSFDPTWEFGGTPDGSVDGTDFADFEVNPGSASVTLSYTSPFSLLSFNGKDSYGGDVNPGTLNLIGNLHGGGTISTSLVILANGAWDAYTLSGWTNLDSVQFTGLPHNEVLGTLMSLDNISVDTSANPNPVPVPATLWLLLSGFAGITYSASRKSRIA